MTSTLIVNARLVNEGREFDGHLRFADGRIEQRDLGPVIFVPLLSGMVDR